MLARRDRAQVPPGTPGIMATRTLANSHPGLLALLRPGLDVLDVGCGPGTLTIETARRVLPGRVVGLDVNEEMLAAARQASPPGALPNLTFLHGDIRDGGWDTEFDLVGAARVLQWIRDVERAVTAMVAALRPGGLMIVLDYDHTRARWANPPAAWIRFHRAFLDWRANSGLDNALALRLPDLLEAAGLVELRVTPLAVTVSAGQPDFFRVAGAWRLVAESRGRQMVSAGALTEAEREAAVADYAEWMRREDAVQTLHEACVTGRRP